MEAWWQTIGVCALCGVGCESALWLGRQRKGWWIAGYAISLGIVLIYGVEHYTSGLESVPPFSWVTAGKTPHVIAAFLVPILLLTPGRNLPNRPNPALLGGLTGMFLVSFVVLPFLLAAVAYPKLAALKTTINADGVCLQQTDYTCGPAAATTGLRKLGLRADEGQLAIWSQTTQYGTTTDDLLNALKSHYGTKGLSAEYRKFTSPAELQDAGIVLAVMKYDLMVDHFVAVLGVQDGKVIVADPVNGLIAYSETDFAKIWRHSGIVLRRERAKT